MIWLHRGLRMVATAPRLDRQAPGDGHECLTRINDCVRTRNMIFRGWLLPER